MTRFQIQVMNGSSFDPRTNSTQITNGDVVVSLEDYKWRGADGHRTLVIPGDSNSDYAAAALFQSQPRSLNPTHVEDGDVPAMISDKYSGLRRRVWLKRAGHPTKQNVGGALDTLIQDKEPPKSLVVEVMSFSAELIAYLQKHPEALHSLRSRQFEELVAELLSGYGWEVQLNQPTKDGGFDIFGITRNRAGVSSSWLVECKRWKTANKVGIAVARALYGVKQKLGVANAMLATTSAFTSGVVRFKESTWDFELKNYQGILKWINEYRPHPSGQLYLRNNRLIVP